jgi:hypothetical protein
MNAFTYTRADDVATAVDEIAADGAARLIAGGTNLIKTTTVAWFSCCAMFGYGRWTLKPHGSTVRFTLNCVVSPGSCRKST